MRLSADPAHWSLAPVDAPAARTRTSSLGQHKAAHCSPIAAGKDNRIRGDEWQCCSAGHPCWGAKGLCPDPQPQLPGAVWGAHGEHPGYGPPRAAGVMGCGEGDFQPPSCISLSRIPDASRQGEEGNGSRERTQGQIARGGEGRGGGSEGRKGVPHAGGESLFIHPPSPFPHTNHRGSLSSGYL